jgi:hypothetical protein
MPGRKVDKVHAPRRPRPVSGAVYVEHYRRIERVVLSAGESDAARV